MNREHYLSKRLHSQHGKALGRHDEQERGAGTDAFLEATGSGESKRKSPAIAGKAEAGIDLEIKPEVR